MSTPAVKSIRERFEAQVSALRVVLDDATHVGDDAMRFEVDRLRMENADLRTALNLERGRIALMLASKDGEP